MKYALIIPLITIVGWSVWQSYQPLESETKHSSWSIVNTSIDTEEIKPIPQLLQADIAAQVKIGDLFEPGTDLRGRWVIDDAGNRIGQIEFAITAQEPPGTFATINIHEYTTPPKRIAVYLHQLYHASENTFLLKGANKESIQSLPNVEIQVL